MFDQEVIQIIVQAGYDQRHLREQVFRRAAPRGDNEKRFLHL
jgi:hypothetical protein